MILSIALMFAGVGALCLLMYRCAVCALPVAVGCWAGYWAFDSGAGAGSVVFGLAAGGLVFALGQVILGTARSPTIRLVALLVFIAPAGYAGYAMVLQLGEISIPSPLWQHLFAVIGAVAVGVSAAARFAMATPSPRSLKSSAVAELTVHHPIGLQKTMLLPE